MSFSIASKPASRSCVYCGDSPVNHTMHFIEAGLSSLSFSFFPPRERPVSPFFQFSRSELIHLLTTVLTTIASWFGVIRFSTNKEDAVTHRTESIWNEAERRGIRMELVVVFGLKRELLRAWLPRKAGSSKCTWQYFESIPIPPWLNQYGVAWVDDKYRLKKVFQKHNLPIPQGNSVSTERGAQAVFSELSVPVITKPREGSRGRHTTIAIKDSEELSKAFARAQQLCPFVLVEEYIPGRVYRATCIGKKVIGVMELVRPVTVADGVKTVNELREYHNAHNKDFPELTDVPNDALFHTAMIHQGFTFESVPPKGTEILLAEFSERTNGGYFVDCTDDIPQSTKDTIERAATVCGVDLIGFDIISRDLTNADERFVFIEGNTLPYIEIHDIPYAGKVRNVSGAIFDLWK